MPSLRSLTVSMFSIGMPMLALCILFLSRRGMSAHIGMGQPGSECRSNRDCATSTFCDRLVHRCIRKPKVSKKKKLPHLVSWGAVGTKCDDDSSCQPDLYCSSEKSQCVRKAKEGEMCEAAEHCHGNLKCGAEGLCTPVSGDIGSVCSDSADCADNLQCFVLVNEENNGTVSKKQKVPNKRCVTPCNGRNDCGEKQVCQRGMCIGMNYGPCMPMCDHGLQCNRITNKCRPKTSVMEKCDDDGKASCVQECLKTEAKNPDRIVYCGFCCLKGCRCFNGPGWLKLVSSEFLARALGSYYSYNMSIA